MPTSKQDENVVEVPQTDQKEGKVAQKPGKKEGTKLDVVTTTGPAKKKRKVITYDSGKQPGKEDIISS